MPRQKIPDDFEAKKFIASSVINDTGLIPFMIVFHDKKVDTMAARISIYPDTNKISLTIGFRNVDEIFKRLALLKAIKHYIFVVKGSSEDEEQTHFVLEKNSDLQKMKEFISELHSYDPNLKLMIPYEEIFKQILVKDI